MICKGKQRRTWFRLNNQVSTIQTFRVLCKFLFFFLFPINIPQHPNSRAKSNNLSRQKYTIQHINMDLKQLATSNIVQSGTGTAAKSAASKNIAFPLRLGPHCRVYNQRDVSTHAKIIDNYQRLQDTTTVLHLSML